ncbi:hypothetical protein CE143_18935 [Photorhabdus luminescens]|uniref:NamB n=3 Tax=Photorhabdus TaxID=29487 RepID=Q84H19_PHOLU|nr:MULTISPECIES: hypothetical protein [Photorhabdus]AAO18073.1 unknown [Photorhabdus luminescens]AFQ59988.1 NamB [Photorhabdus luminescens]EYU17324.1 hypothetical protein BA1DRAFT_00104 [Photorhabdus aegyptia]KGM28558.1 hypothetical protein KS18_08990 [Photorhabdus luminescens]MBS9428525.1 hypothetical protein [Photorhabdus akhurstii]
MIEKTERIAELEKIIDSQLTSSIYSVSNFVGNDNDVHLTGGSLTRTYTIMPMETVWGIYASVPIIGPNTDIKIIKPLDFHVMTKYWENVGKIWLFQEARAINGVIKYCVGDNFNYLASREAQGNNNSGGSKNLKVVCRVPGDLNTAQMILY